MRKRSRLSLLKAMIWLLLCFCFAGIPAIILNYSFSKYFEMADEMQREQVKSELQLALTRCSAAGDLEKFWCRRLSDQFQAFSRDKTQLAEVRQWLSDNRQKFNQCFDFIIWKPDGKIFENQTSEHHSESDWHPVFQELAAVSEKYKERSWSVKRPASLDKVREILGPQYVGEMIESNTHAKLYGFAWTDSARKKPMLWTFFNDNGGCLLLFYHQKLFSDSFLRRMIKNESEDRTMQWGLFDSESSGGRVWLNHSGSYKTLKQTLENCEENLLGFAETEELMVAIAFLTPHQRIFTVARRELSQAQRTLNARLAAFILLVLMFPFYRYTYRTLVLEEPGSLGIRPRLAFLFFFANALPFLGMSIISQEYYMQKRSAFLKDLHKRSIDLLKDYDQRLTSVQSVFEHKTQTFFDNWVAGLRNGLIDNESNEQISRVAKENQVDRFYLVSSSSSLVGTFSGVKKVEESLEVKEKSQNDGMTKEQFSIDKNDSLSAQMFNLIGKRILGELNGVAKSNHAATKIELLMESLLQKSFAEISHSFIKAMGGISVWGFGKIQNLTMLKFMSITGSEMVDFMAVVLWNAKTIQNYYIDTTLTSINRNPTGLKVVARIDFSREFFPQDFKPDPGLAQFVDRATDRPNEEIEIIDFNQEKYMAICFSGRHLERYKLLGLYPLSRLDRVIGRQKNDLVTLGILSILLGLVLAQMLSRSFVEPLQQLSETAIAIENRDFSFKQSEPEKDEFGEISLIFSEVMTGLEELEVARVVQESLFPDNRLAVGDVEVYGKSITMAELGGDYFDFFAIDDQSCGVLMGDVAGHGVGAALIMAMAKSGILSSREHLNSPQRLLENLHQLIYSSKTSKQKKVMTFQYLCLNSQTGKGSYSNAGACSPIYISGSGSEARELTLAGAALGAFKKARFSELNLEFAEGDALVFYTDGIIEARNKFGQELGYNQFAQLARKCWNPDPEKIYKCLYQAYLEHIGGQAPEDDLTMVVVVFKGRRPEIKIA
ncbi:MAG: SpoIIE family protein phosphatase [Candidatus Rifleibacteriota bacterium]